VKRTTFPVALLLTAALLAASAYSRSAATPKTLVLAKGTIAAFAQDGGRISWASVETSKPCPWLVRVRTLATKKQKAVNSQTGPTCHSDTGFDPAHTTYLALAGSRALWTLWASGNSTYYDLVTGSLTTKPDVQLQELVYSNALEDGDHLGGLAGDGKTLVYGVVGVGVTGPPDCDLEGTCTLVVSGGGVKRVSGDTAVSVPGAPAPALLVASGGRIALVVATVAEPSIDGGAHPTVQIRNAATGALIRTISPGGQVKALALAPKVVAVLVSAAAGKRIELYSQAGVLLRTVAVPLSAAALSTTNTRAVFRVGSSIRLVDIASGAVSTVATAAATPIGLSIEGKRVAWAENVKIGGVLRGRIRAVTLP
jgi:hypothetical protein